ncbi:MAG: (E)-4-hydroxy-3-methylbut-2-enyl-diphosphate synthase [Bacteroidales bacterium]|nr:(E)-4-hydroxy-3-methylbut-2-enyl-diphosphate synthase [Bacteroidales bacterium]
MEKKINTIPVRIGKSLVIGGGNPVVVQSMCNTHTDDVEGTAEQCIRLFKGGSRMVRITCPGKQNVQNFIDIRKYLTDRGFDIPLVADIHFSAETAIAVAPYVEKVRINPGNFHKEHEQACLKFAQLLAVCKEHGTAIRVGVNHGSLGQRITNLYGNTPLGMAKAAMEWLKMCRDNDFDQVVVSLKASNTIVMTEAYRLLSAMMKEEDMHYPLHLGVTEAGNGDSGRIKSCVGVSTLLEEGLGDTVRVSLTEPPENELSAASYLAERYDGKLGSELVNVCTEGKVAYARYNSSSKERLLYDAACDFGRALLLRDLDDVKFSGQYIDEDGNAVDIESSGMAEYLENELLQACRRKFYKPEYIACPGCGRTMYNLQETFEEVKRRTAHLNNVVIAVMGCIVNGPGEMADADWGYVGEGNHKVTIYKGKTPVASHIPDTEAPDLLVSLIEKAI